MTDTIFLLAIFVLEFLLFYFLPTMNAKHTLFGIVLKNDDFQLYGLPILKSYRRDLKIIGAIGLAMTLLLGKFLQNSLPFAYIIATLAIIFLLFKYQRKTWKLRDKSTVSRLATPLKPRYLKDFSNFWFELLVLLSAVFPFAILIFTIRSCRMFCRFIGIYRVKPTAGRGKILQAFSSYRF